MHFFSKQILDNSNHGEKQIVYYYLPKFKVFSITVVMYVTKRIDRGRHRQLRNQAIH